MSSDLAVLIPFDMLLQVPVILSLPSMVDTLKIEARVLLRHTSACLNNGEALGKSKALKTLPTEIHILKDLPFAGSFKKAGGKDITRASTFARRWAGQRGFADQLVAIATPRISISKYV
ncbi:hypothetical protein GJ744_004655 [Endocarpon pusillum]|uniref:Uncharacterized protein n=1 Tax=Endocarpon pusillum TaxID=364733 RepID=A0A8H7E990_9EURO|nr:hypothetical protein GJ744_004655 [Endocarpon pusillum]